MSAESHYNKGEQDSEENQANELEGFGETGEAENPQAVDKKDDKGNETINQDRRTFLKTIGAVVTGAIAGSLSKPASAKDKKPEKAFANGEVDENLKEVKKRDIKEIVVPIDYPEARKRGRKAIKERRSYSLRFRDGRGRADMLVRFRGEESAIFLIEYTGDKKLGVERYNISEFEGLIDDHERNNWTVGLLLYKRPQ